MLPELSGPILEEIFNMTSSDNKTDDSSDTDIDYYDTDEMYDTDCKEDSGYNKVTQNQERNNIDEEENDRQEDSTDYENDDRLDELLGIKKGECKWLRERHHQSRTGLQREISLSLPLPTLVLYPNLLKLGLKQDTSLNRWSNATNLKTSLNKY